MQKWSGTNLDVQEKAMNGLSSFHDYVFNYFGIIKMDPTESMMNAAFARVKALHDFYLITAQDWPHFETESPKLMERIREIESTPILGYEEMQSMCHKWIENHHLIFRRRCFHRRQ